MEGGKDGMGWAGPSGRRAQVMQCNDRPSRWLDAHKCMHMHVLDSAGQVGSALLRGRYSYYYYCRWAGLSVRGAQPYTHHSAICLSMPTRMVRDGAAPTARALTTLHMG